MVLRGALRRFLVVLDRVAMLKKQTKVAAPLGTPPQEGGAPHGA